MRIASILVLIVVVTFSPALRGEAMPSLVVERSAGAERCLDADALAAKVEQIRGRSAIDAPTAYHVTFARTDEGFTATIRIDRAASVRTLDHEGSTCSALGHAVALTLALLLDSDLEPKKKSEPPPLPAAAPAATPAPLPPAPPTRAREATLSLAAAGLVGVLRPVSPAFSAEIGASFAPVRAGVGAIWGWPQTFSLGPGAVHERLLGGFARVCVPAWARDGFRFDACSGALAGAVTAEAEGYTRNERRTRAWFAVPVEAAFARWTPPVGWEVSFAGLLPLQRPDYTIDGVGTAYRSPPIGALLSLKMVGLVAW